MSSFLKETSAPSFLELATENPVTINQTKKNKKKIELTILFLFTSTRISYLRFDNTLQIFKITNTENATCHSIHY